MNFQEFVGLFGGAARTKNLADPMCGILHSKSIDNRRSFVIPPTSQAPANFIRLCPWEIEYLYVVARRATKGILEIGRFNGGSALVLACAAPSVPIYSIDIQPRNDTFLQDLFKKFAIGRNVHLIVGDSQQKNYSEIPEVDILFIDGDHSYNGCMNDLLTWYDHLAVGGHLIVHDCYSGSLGVQDAVLDFWNRHSELRSVQSPYIGSTFWNYPAGSLAHLVKTSACCLDQRE